MLSHKKTYTSLTVPLILLLCIIIPLGAGAVVDEEALIVAKTELNDMWHAAAETTKRRSELEQTLAQFDRKVANAKRDLTNASDQRKEIRLEIEQRLTLIDAMKEQIDAAQQTRDFYQKIAETKKQDFIDFVRYLVSKDIAMRESGPSAGGDLLKRILRQSLGEAVERQMADQAILLARQQFFSQVDVLIAESERVGQELHASADDLSGEISELEKKYGTVSSIVLEKKAFIDDSWRQKKLTQDQLAAVANEAAESLSRISGMQTTLIKVNDELKDQKVKVLRDDMAALTTTLTSLEARRDALQLKDKAMQLIQDSALQALQEATQAKGTDKKLYKRIEELQIQRSSKADELHILQVTNANADPPVLSDPAVDELESAITSLDNILDLMKDGIPQDLAEKYYVAKIRARNASEERIVLAQQISDVSAQAAAASVEVSAKAGEIDAVASQFTLTDLPPIFLWPVNGRVTAGYLDADYVNVFHVPHRGMDIAIGQGSPVRSVSDGVVYAVHDGGLTGYSYIIVAHRNGYASLYGHVSAFLARQGDIVQAGQVIALSGGAPGTHGAGWMTTGSHVHLEMTKDGKHINPQSMLPPR